MNNRKKMTISRLIREKRNQEILQFAKKGMFKEDIARHFNMNKERVRQILNTYNVKAVNKWSQLKQKNLQEGLKQAEKLAKQLGRVPRHKEFIAAGIVYNSIYFNYYKEHLVKLGFSLWKDRYLAQYIITKLQELAKQLGRTPGILDCIKAGLSQYYIDMHFGSVINAQKQAGLISNNTGRNKQYDSEYLLDKLRELAQKLGRTPRITDVLNNQYKGCHAYHRRFGSFNNALKQAGLKLNEEYGKRKVSDKK